MLWKQAGSLAGGDGRAGRPQRVEVKGRGFGRFGGMGPGGYNAESLEDSHSQGFRGAWNTCSCFVNEYI